MQSNYLDTEAIFTTQSSVPVTFLYDVYGLGFLNPHNDGSEDIKSGTKTILPFWIAKTLANQNFVRIEVPVTHGEAIQRDLQADPNVVDFKNNPYFYEMGMLLPSIKNIDFHDVFKGRFKDIVNKALNWGEEDTHDATEAMSESEKRLFTLGYKTSSDFRKWYNREEHTIEAPTL